jgi:hypothetical protein
MAFLKQVFEDAQHVKALAHKHPEWQPMVARAFTLYREVTENALVIEKAAGSDKR